jgi:hypothetical protein
VCRKILTAGLVATYAALAGCGYSRTPVPNVTSPARAGGFRSVVLPKAGVSFRLPRSWIEVGNSAAPLDYVFVSGPAVVSLWRYQRSAPPPATSAALAGLRGRLLVAARARDRGLVVIRSKLTRLGSVYAIVLDAIESITGAERRVRSLHVFVPGSEIVLEEYAPVSMFHAVDHAVFSPLNHSLVCCARPR